MTEPGTAATVGIEMNGDRVTVTFRAVVQQRIAAGAVRRQSDVDVRTSRKRRQAPAARTDQLERQHGWRFIPHLHDADDEAIRLCLSDMRLPGRC